LVQKRGGVAEKQWGATSLLVLFAYDLVSK